MEWTEARSYKYLELLFSIQDTIVAVCVCVCVIYCPLSHSLAGC